METSIKIESIKQDSQGFKLIAFSKVLYFSGVKPWASPCMFADYKEGVLRKFEGNSITSISVNSFKEALNHLRKNL